MLQHSFFPSSLFLLRCCSVCIALRGTSVLMVMGKGRRKVFNGVHIQRLPNFEYFLRLQGFILKYQSLQRCILKLFHVYLIVSDYSMSCTYFSLLYYSYELCKYYSLPGNDNIMNEELGCVQGATVGIRARYKFLSLLSKFFEGAIRTSLLPSHLSAPSG